MSTANRLHLLPDFIGKRFLKIGLRTAHLLAISGVCGGVFFNVDTDSLHYFWLGAISTGLAMLLIDALSNLIWFVQVRGIVITGKLAILSVYPFVPEWSKPLIVLIMIASATISHAPGGWRYYSLFHGKVVKSSHDSKG